ncbi:glycosyltransferase family 1 protein [Salinisphaera sp. SPP-AMP-43]|uniref:glycosyltransferase family 4 protein n=1 Tax=Salinisphaera sp. SPP-AMP-43 TaxID=3121288 RepID=UPI003C6E0F85
MTKFFVNGRFLSQRVSGVQRFAREIVRALKVAGWHFEVLAPCDADLNGFESVTSVVGRTKGHVWEQVELPRAVPKDGILISLGNTAPFICNRQVVTLHDVAYLHHPESFNWKIRHLYKACMPLLISRARHVVTVSEFSKSEISRTYNLAETDISVIYNGVASAFQPADTPRQSQTILAIADNGDQKNYVAILRAAQALSYRYPLELRVVGSSTRFHHETEFNRFNDRSQITLLGHLDDDEFAREYANATCFVFAPFYAGFGIPPIEAQMCGCPVIVGSATVFPEVLRDSVLYFDSSNPAALALQIERVFNDEALRQSLASRGLSNAARFSWCRSAEKLKQVAEIVANERY